MWIKIKQWLCWHFWHNRYNWTGEVVETWCARCGKVKY